MRDYIGLDGRWRSQRGALPLLLAVAAVLVLILLLILVLFVAQRASHDDGTGDGTSDTEGSSTTSPSDKANPGPDDDTDSGPVQIVNGCIIFSRHPRVNSAFIEKTVQIARQLRTDPNFLMATFKVESDFDHTIRNQVGGTATGLNQITDKSARGIGLPNAAALASMSAVQQLEYVRRYFVMAGGGGGRMRTPEDCYIANFYPRALGQADGYVIASRRVACTKDSRRWDAYCGNEPYDYDRNGTITKSEAARKVRKIYDTEIRKCKGA